MRSLRERFESKVDRSGECHLWRGFVDRAGYGRLRYGGRADPVGYAHRIAYELERGAIPDGLVIDHLCRERTCVRVDHLEPVPPSTNTARGHTPTVLLHNAGVCAKGHPASESYRRRSTGAVVYCRPCRREKENHAPPA